MAVWRRTWVWNATLHGPRSGLRSSNCVGLEFVQRKLRDGRRRSAQGQTIADAEGQAVAPRSSKQSYIVYSGIGLKKAPGLDGSNLSTSEALHHDPYADHGRLPFSKPKDLPVSPAHPLEIYVPSARPNTGRCRRLGFVITAKVADQSAEHAW